jgi:hypothetical protein
LDEELKNSEESTNSFEEEAERGQPDDTNQTKLCLQAALAVLSTATPAVVNSYSCYSQQLLKKEEPLLKRLRGLKPGIELLSEDGIL